MEFDQKVLQCFLDNQLQLFPEPVADTEEEAASFLEDTLAVVLHSRQEVKDYFQEEGIDLEGADVLEEAEVFDVGDGRYLVVEG